MQQQPGGERLDGTRLLTPSLWRNSHPTPGGPPNCSRGRSADSISASWWVWASLSPGKMRKAPSKDPSTASPRRTASLITGSLERRDGLRKPTLVRIQPLDTPPTCTHPHDPVPRTYIQSQSCFFRTGSRCCVMLARPGERTKGCGLLRFPKLDLPTGLPASRSTCPPPRCQGSGTGCQSTFYMGAN